MRRTTWVLLLALLVAGCSDDWVDHGPRYLFRDKRTGLEEEFLLSRDVGSVYALIQASYLHRQSIPPDPGAFATVEDLLAALNDPFTFERSAAQADEAQQGAVTGSKGFSIARLDTFFYVNTIDEGGPAFREGLRLHDVIVSLAGQAVDAGTADDVIRDLLGRNPLSLDVERAGQPVQVTASAEDFTAVAVSERSLDAATHYVRITRFFGATVDPRGPAGELERVLADNAQKSRWVLDLRWNSGGSIGRACEIVDLFLGSGPIVTLENFRNEILFSCSAAAGHPGEGKQVVILQNGSSASSSEVVAGALREGLGAPLVGETSLGKGVGQQVYDYLGGGQLILVTFRLRAGNSTTWDTVGLSPDVAVPLDPTLLLAGEDSQLTAAVAALGSGSTASPLRGAPAPSPASPPALLKLEGGVSASSGSDRR